ncbi:MULTISPECIES: TPM domain-containing protein [Lactobacillus]|uniref:TPM domain-containing protein n=1 Tax=Lactobacillus xujianguonis TaxID=2495899 RepID=A0A437SVS3_9LACO|nr:MULTISPECIES: TPM domain-containing protein [Lactobacillus]RVU71025.1 TPM domain-containing protein [Lactobacillus xujianguonis]RVU73905.1 TPM domain-containing protein [Lactobacillus xujianguonis]
MKIGKKEQLILIAVLSLILLFFPTNKVKADTKVVFDQAQVLNHKTKANLARLNETKLKKLRSYPEIAVVIITSLQDTGCKNVSELHKKLVAERNFGTAAYMNGALIVLRIKDHQLEVIPGNLSKNNLTQKFLTNLVNSAPVQHAFEQKDYDRVVTLLASHLTQRLSQAKESVPVMKSKHKKAEKKENVGLTVFWIVITVLILFLMYSQVWRFRHDGYGIDKFVPFDHDKNKKKELE